ncbi:MAG: hypothetical protein M1821_006446 [Bathelium mastoideum]|nr:MAG: hypothetical protein M1821_006446 [Bathelium mastoideum]
MSETGSIRFLCMRSVRVLRTEVCNDPVAFVCPDIKVAVQALALTVHPGSPALHAVDRGQNEDQLRGQTDRQHKIGHGNGTIATKEANQALLEAVEKIQQQKARLPSPSFSEITGGPGADETATNVRHPRRRDIATDFDAEPIRPVPEPITPPDFGI